MRRTKEKVVLVFHSSVRSSWNETICGFYRFARAQRWNVQVIEHSPNRTSIDDLLSFWHPDGVVVEGGMDEDGAFLSDAFEHVPTIYLACDQRQLRSGVSRVNHDSESLGRVAAREFLSLGLASYGFFGFTDIFWSDERWRAFADTLKLNGRSATRFTRRFFEAEGGEVEKGFRRSFSGWLRSLPKPTGVLAANDLLGVEALNVCAAIGLEVPDDVSVLGIDNDEVACENAKPTLSSIRPNFDQAGYLAAELLAERLAHPRTKDAPAYRTFAAAGIVRRQSTRRLPRANADVAKAMEIIRLNACSGLKPRDIFPELTCSRRLAELRFRELIGHSVLDEILAVRLARVKELLAREDVPIDTIAARCGWKSLTQLRDVFRRSEGVGLREWRRGLRKAD